MPHGNQRRGFTAAAAVLLFAAATAHSTRLGADGTLPNALYHSRALGDAYFLTGGATSMHFYALPLTDCATYAPPLSPLLATFSPACCVHSVAECAARCAQLYNRSAMLGSFYPNDKLCTGVLLPLKHRCVCTTALTSGPPCSLQASKSRAAHWRRSRLACRLRLLAHPGRAASSSAQRARATAPAS